MRSDSFTVSIKLLLAAAVLALGATNAHAATVKTERILIDPQTPGMAPIGGADVPSGVLRYEGRTTAPDTDPSADEKAPGASDAADAPLPEVFYGDTDLPKPVQRMRAQMLDAASSGDIERLRPVLEANEVMPTLAFDTFDDPIEFLKQSSGDTEGREVLAILMEVLEAGFVHVDAGTPQEMYIWPYFARYPLDKLDARQTVELFKILTAADLDEMKSFGAYIFYRVGIGPDGTLHFFVAGD